MIKVLLNQSVVLGLLAKNSLNSVNVLYITQ